MAKKSTNKYKTSKLGFVRSAEFLPYELIQYFTLKKQTASTDTVTLSLVRISWGGTSKEIVLQVIFLNKLEISQKSDIWPEINHSDVIHAGDDEEKAWTKKLQ